MRTVPTFRPQEEMKQELSGWSGINSTDQPTELKPNILSGLLNGYIHRGLIEKRNGSTLYSTTLASVLSEAFTSTDNKDATNTTGDWATDGTANLLINSTTLSNESTVGYDCGYSKDRHIILSSTGITVITYQDGGGIKAKMSTAASKGAAWTNLAGAAGETTITTDTNAFWSLTIDGSDNIHVVYQSDDSNSKIHYRKLTYDTDGGIHWDVGSEKTVATSTTVDCTWPSIAIKTDGTLYVSWTRNTSSIYISKSTDGGDTWTTDASLIDGEAETVRTTALVIHEDAPFLVYQRRDALDNNKNYLCYAVCVSGTWTSFYMMTTILIEANADHQFSICDFNADYIAIIIKTGVGMKVYFLKDTTTAGFYTLTYIRTVSNDVNDVQPSITSDGTRLWCLWSDYEAASQFEVVYRIYNGVSTNTWETTKNLTSDNGYNVIVNTAPTVSGQTIFPIMWRPDTTSPYNVSIQVSQLSGVIQSNGLDSGAGSRTYTANVTTSAPGSSDSIATTYADCATVDGDYGTFGAIGSQSAQYIKFKITMSTIDLAASYRPSCSGVEIYYGGNKVVGLHGYTRNDGTNYILAISGTQVFLYHADGPKVIGTGLTTDLPTTSAKFQDALLIANGTDVIKRFNGKVTTGNTVTVGGASHTTVTGSGTHWATASHADQLNTTGTTVAPGAKIKIASAWYGIASVDSDTQLTLSSAASDGAGQAYEAYAILNLAGSPPTGKYIAVFNDHVFVAGNSTNTTRLQFSDIDDCVTWPAANFVDVNVSDGQKITGLVPIGNILQIEKYSSTGDAKSVWGLRGSSVDDFTIDPLTTEFAGIDQKACVVTPNEAYLLDRYGIIRTDGTNFERIDYPIEVETDSWAQQYINNAIGTFYDDKIIFAIPSTSSSTINDLLIIYDLRNGTITKHSGVYPGCFCVHTASYTPQLYFGSSIANGTVYTWDTGTSDDGAAINLEVITAEIDMGNYFIDKKFMHLYLQAEHTGSYDVTIYYSVNGNSTYTQLQDPVTVSNTSGDVFKRWNLSGAIGSTIKFKLVNNKADQAIKLVKMLVTALPRGLRRNQ